MDVFFDWRWYLIKTIFGIKLALIWKKSEPVFNKIFLKTIIKSYGDEVIEFYDKEIPEMDFNRTYLAIISFDSVLNKDGNYYPQVFWKSANTLHILLMT